MRQQLISIALQALRRALCQPSANQLNPAVELIGILAERSNVSMEDLTAQLEELTKEFEDSYWTQPQMPAGVPMSRRQFTRYIVEVDVLVAAGPDEELPSDLGAIDAWITTGDGVGTVNEVHRELISAAKCAELCFEFASDPGFFQLGEHGEEDDDTEPEEE